MTVDSLQEIPAPKLCESGLFPWCDPPLLTRNLDANRVMSSGIKFVPLPGAAQDYSVLFLVRLHAGSQWSIAFTCDDDSAADNADLEVGRFDMKSVLLLFVMFLAIFAGGCSSSDEMAKENLTQIMRSGSRPIVPEPQSDTYVIRQGDQIQISVWGYPEFTVQNAVVKENGTINVPLVGDVVAAGLTKEQFSNDLKKKLAEYIQGEIKLTVSVLSSVVQKVTVLGAVSRQENYPLTADASLLEVISTAGGTTPDSDLRHIRILRGGVNRQPIEVDLTWYMENGDIDAIPIIRPGDTVFIPKKANVIRDLSDFLRDAIFIFGFFRVFN